MVWDISSEVLGTTGGRASAFPPPHRDFPTDRYQIAACEVSEDVIEMYVLGGLPDADAELIQHLKTCPECSPRVLEAQTWSRSVDRAFKASAR